MEGLVMILGLKMELNIGLISMGVSLQGMKIAMGFGNLNLCLLFRMYCRIVMMERATKEMKKYATPKFAYWLGAKVKNIDDRGEMSAVGLPDRNGVLLVEVPPACPAEWPHR